MKKIFALLMLTVLLASLVPCVSAVESGWEIDYSDSVDWNKFRDQGVTLNV